MGQSCLKNIYLIDSNIKNNRISKWIKNLSIRPLILASKNQEINFSGKLAFTVKAKRMNAISL